KANCGFNYPLTGCLLCLAKLDYTDLSIQQQLKSGEYDLQPTDWPLFFYENDTYNSDDEIQGLLRSKLLVQVCQPHTLTS
ncbi:hypothetical protein JB92DRAFT_2550005, partial [Gautieria morchelliformis]